MAPPQRPTDPALWERLRVSCAALGDGRDDGPGQVSERTSHGELAWYVGTGRRARQFATTWDHHHDDRNAVVMAAPPGVQERLVAEQPDRYFRPPYVGGRGWIGVYLDRDDLDWDLIELHLADAFATVSG